MRAFMGKKGVLKGCYKGLERNRHFFSLLMFYIFLLFPICYLFYYRAATGAVVLMDLCIIDIDDNSYHNDDIYRIFKYYLIIIFID